MKSRSLLFAAGLLGASGVALGAFGAHALRVQLTELGTRDRWETAVFYQLVHAVALLGAALWLRSTSPGAAARRIAWAGRCWTVGIVLFSGSLYVMAVTAHAPLWLKAAVPPLGGMAFIAGWLWVVGAAAAKDE
jgi:uncharacterized membrane protein YgdD (TMEM256/DUF423 family)